MVAPESFVKRAAALRTKYHMPDFAGKPEWTITLDEVAPHPWNCNGVRMNGQRCEELFLQVFRKFDYAEACHGAVCVDKRDDSADLARFHALQANDPQLACLPVETLRFASLGSSHINQVLRNIVGAAVVRNCPEATDASGRLNLALIAPRDSALAEACRVGLRWEVLSAKLEQENPDGVLCIQAALNDPARAAMLVHEMQIVKQLADVCTAESNVAGEVRLETIRARLVAEGVPCATTSSFLPLLQFVVEQGGNNKHGFVESLVEFHQLFVNPRVRRLREAHFRVVCALPSPRLRLVLLKVAYGCPASALRDGWIDYFGPQHVSKIMSKHAKAFALADKLAARFHSEYGHAGVWKEPGSVRLLHAFDIELGRILLCKEGYQGTAEEVAATAGIFDAKVRDVLLAALAAKLCEALPVAAVPRESKMRKKGNEPYTCRVHSGRAACTSACSRRTRGQCAYSLGVRSQRIWASRSRTWTSAHGSVARSDALDVSRNAGSRSCASRQGHDGACDARLCKRHAPFAATGARNAANSGSVQPPAQGRRRGWDANLLSHSVLEAIVAASILGGPSSRGRRRLQRRSAAYQGQRRALYRHDGAASTANATVRRHGDCFGAGVG